MCGLSASFLFAIVTNLIRRDTEAEREEVHADSTSSFALAGEPGQQNGLGPIEKIESSTGLARRFSHHWCQLVANCFGLGGPAGAAEER
jgi:hypothetical protein